MNRPALPGGATVLAAGGEILPIEITGEVALTVGGESVSACDAGSRPGGPHSGEQAGRGTPVIEDVIGRIIPNPLHPGSRIEWSAGHKAVTIEVYDVGGRLVRSFRAAGSAGLRATWNGRTSSGREMQTGIYLLRIREGESNLTKRVLFLR